jgi:hypothetical protein
VQHSDFQAKDSCPDESFRVKLDAAIEPSGIRVGTSHEEYVSDLVFLGQSRLIISPPNGFKVIASLESYDLRVWSKYYIRRLFDSANQISRHLIDQTCRSDEHMLSIQFDYFT